MMAELEIDQSHLPRVQKVCQCFAVLEDGVLAHSLQEQEIEQHYSSNVQKSQRVQTDLRVAKRLQDEEEREAPLSQTARRLEEQDFEYALMIQDEIQRCSEEARRREREDEEVAKRIQEEEEMGAKHRKLESGCHGNSTAFPLCEEHRSNPHLPPPSVLASTRFIPCPRPLRPPATRGQRPVCGASSKSITDPLSPVCGTSRAPRLGARPAAVPGPIGNGPGNSRCSGRGSGCGSGCGSGVLWWLTTAAHRPGKWLNSAPCGQLGASGYTQGEGSCCSCRRLREDRAGGGGKERIVGLGGQGPGTDLRSAGEGSGGARGGNVCPQDGVCRWTYRANGAAAERRVHFLDEGRRCHSHHGDRKRRSLGCVDSPDSGRCRAVRRGYHGDLTQRAGGVGVDGVTVGSEDPVWHSYRGNTSSGQRGSRGVFSGDGGQGRGPDRSRTRRGEAPGNRGGGVSHRGSGNQDYGTPVSETDSACHLGDGAEREGLGGGSHRNCQKGGGGGGRGRGCGASVSGVQEGVASGRGYRGNRRARWRARRRWRGSVEESSSEEEVQRREERRKRGGVRHNERAEGAELWQRGAGLWQRGAGLELGSLQQVLLDQELAWSLQEEEEDIHRKLRRGSRSPPRPPSADPEDDFRAAQVAQDEEIARFMQRQEMKTKWRSCDLEGQGSRGERDDSGGTRQSRECPERKLQVQREEPPSANEERIDPKPASTAHQRQPIRNIAEELDPTFKARRKGMSQARPTSSDLCLTPPTPHRGFHDYSDEPLFIPPTKRRSDRSGRGKAKEKKEGCKQQ